MEKKELTEFRLTHNGENWWHFRKEKDLGYFTVSLIHDGTVVLSGDYGVLAFRQKYFPESMKELLGFPNSKTNIGYFAEKVCNCVDSSTIMEWTKERAVEDCREYLIEYYPDCAPHYIERILGNIENIEHERGDAGLFEMLNLLRDFDNQGDWCDGKPIGMGYTHRFKVQFELIRYAMDMIRAEAGRE